MQFIESKALTDLYEIRRRISEEIKDMDSEERTAYFRRNAQAALDGLNIKTKTVQAPPRPEDREMEELSFNGEK